MTAPRKRSGILTCESCRKFFQTHSERVSNGKAVLCPTGMVLTEINVNSVFLLDKFKRFLLLVNSSLQKSFCHKEMK